MSNVKGPSKEMSNKNDASLVKRKRGSKTLISHDGYSFKKKFAGKQFTSYWCKSNRSKESECSFKIKISTTTDNVLEFGKHGSSCYKFTPFEDITNLPSKNSVVDYTDYMKDKTEQLALEDLSLGPIKIWDIVSEEINSKAKTWKGLSDVQVKSLVKKVRDEKNGEDIFRKLENPPMCRVKNSNFYFLQYNISLFDNDNNKTERLMIYGNPALFGLMNGKVQLYIDGTFRIVPNPFYQCLIIMVFDVQTAVYVPVFYVLMSGKHETLYWHALHWIFVGSKWKLDPFSVTCDYERGLHNAVVRKFRDTMLNGCLFHWKQANRRKMVDLKMETKQIKLAMTRNVLDILTIIPRDEILSKGIPYVRDIIDAEVKTKKDRQLWDEFWGYFKKYWMSTQDFISTWNIFDTEKKYIELQNRTSNALERYNRTLSENISTPYPSLIQFVTTLEEEARRQVTRLENIRNGKEIAPTYQDTTGSNRVPDCYTTFKP